MASSTHSVVSVRASGPADIHAGNEQLRCTMREVSVASLVVSSDSELAAATPVRIHVSFEGLGPTVLDAIVTECDPGIAGYRLTLEFLALEPRIADRLADYVGDRLAMAGRGRGRPTSIPAQPARHLATTPTALAAGAARVVLRGR